MISLFLLLGQLVNLFDALVGHLLDLFQSMVFQIFGDLFLFQQLFQPFIAISTNVCEVQYGDPQRSCEPVLARDFASFLSQSRDGDSNDLAIVRGVEIQVGSENGLFNALNLGDVPGLDW